MPKLSSGISLLLLTILFPQTAAAVTCADAAATQSPESAITIKVLLYAGLDFEFCSVTELSCYSVCACAYRTFDFVDQVTAGDEITKQTRRHSFFAKNAAELQCTDVGS